MRLRSALTGFGNLSEGSLALKGQVANLSAEAFEGTAEVAVRDLAGRHTAVFGPDKSTFSLKPGEKKGIGGQVRCGPAPMRQGRLPIKIGTGRSCSIMVCRSSFAREISLETRFIPTPAILQIVLDLGSSANVKKITSGRVRVTSLETKQEVLSQALPAFQSSVSISDLDCSRLPPGRYEAAVELGKGTTSAVLKDVFVKEPKPEWLGNTIGISEKVPAPWTPLKAGGSQRRLLGATIHVRRGRFSQPDQRSRPGHFGGARAGRRQAAAVTPKSCRTVLSR